MEFNNVSVFYLTDVHDEQYAFAIYKMIDDEWENRTPEALSNGF